MGDEQKTQERRIGDCLYSSTPLDPELGMSVSARFLKLLGAGTVHLIQTARTDDDAALDAAAGAAIQAITGNLDDKAVVKLVRDLLSRTVRRKDKMKYELANDSDFNMSYAANYGEMLQAAWFAIEVNRFLGSGEGITNLVAALSGRFQELTSTESSGEPAQD
jgi:hypothetical protein